tara:strand:+ start:1136 stop:1750 length:615 start_codon:yes stop_codon:yes gene_type:complete
MINKQYYEYIPIKSYIYISHLIALLIWSLFIHKFWWKNTKQKGKFTWPILFALSIPYILTIPQIIQYSKNPIYPELSSCMTFYDSEEYIATQNYACSMENIKQSNADTLFMSSLTYNNTYTLLLIMIMSTAFKYNIFENSMIRNFSLWILLNGLWATSTMYLGAFGTSSYILGAMNQVLGTASMGAMLIILVNISNKYRQNYNK